MNNLTGVVLCGGQSKRMGTDKGLILLADQPWAQIMSEKLKAVSLQPVLSINKSQEEKYLQHFKAESLVLDHTEIPGPLNGLMSVHDRFPDQDLLLLACDMINMRTETLETLVSVCTKQSGFDFYAYHNTQFWEPLCAIYTASGLKNIKNQLLKDKDHSFQHILNNEHTYKLEITDLESFRNMNSL
ncbi:MAG: molybdenum cofactor guanylyltransferase [Chryseobacterium sp.]|nr:MAG: molybdenum cofactor guanylyltransferase [Chryseobacterium sp.]